MAGYTFANYNLGTFHPYEVAGGVVPVIAEQLQVDLPSEPSSEGLQALVTKFGTNRVLRANEEVTAIDRHQMVAFAEQGDIQATLDRSFRTPDISATDNADAVIFVGAMANWQDRVLEEILEGINTPVYVVGGNRVMDTATETPNPNILTMHNRLGRYPTEAEYIAGLREDGAEKVPGIIVPRLRELGKSVVVHTMETNDGDELLRDLFREHPELAEQRVAMARVANAGILMAAQVRAAARTISPSFDRDPKHPQLFVVTDHVDLARTPEQEADARHYQKATPAVRQMLLTTKKLFEVTQEDLSA